MWKKQGKINRGHAQIPVVNEIEHPIYRVFVTDREDNKSYIRCFDYNVLTGETSNEAILATGVAGTFDEHGVMTSCLVEDRMYYTGWQKLQNGKYKQSIGVLFDDLSRRQVIDSFDDDHFLCCSPWVMLHDGWKMWFISGRDCGGWSDYGPKYTIRYASSKDGFEWEQQAITFPRQEDEVFARPFVRIRNDVWQMWYSYLHLVPNKAYRIGYAESSDGLNWERLDHLAGIDVSEEGWDSETVAFPFIIQYDKLEGMFYSGNNFGRGGLGYAIRDIQ